MGSNLGGIRQNRQPGCIVKTSKTCIPCNDSPSDSLRGNDGRPFPYKKASVYDKAPNTSDSIENTGAPRATQSSAAIYATSNVDADVAGQGGRVYGLNTVGGRQILQVLNNAIDLRYHFQQCIDTDDISKLGTFNPAGEGGAFGFLYFRNSFMGEPIPDNYTADGGFCRGGGSYSADPRDPDNYTSTYRFSAYEGTYYWYPITTNPSYVNKIVGRNGTALYYNFDGGHRLLSISGDVGRLTPYFGYATNAATYFINTVHLQDALGLDSRTTYYTYDGSSVLQNIIEPNNIVTYFKIAGPNPNWRITSELDPDGNVTYINYDTQPVLKSIQQGARLTYFREDVGLYHSGADVATIDFGTPRQF